jgi:lantibiotic modifying enzyme
MLVRPCVDRLLRAVNYEDDLAYWEPDGINEKQGKPLLGLSHGLIGIAFVLAKYNEYVPSEELGQLTVHCLQRTVQKQFDTNIDSISRYIGGESNPSVNLHWCHGLLGYAWAISQLKDRSPFLQLQLSFSEIILAKTELLDPTMCHGIAGVLDTIRLLKTTGDLPAEKLESAELSYCDLLESMAQEHRDWKLFSSENPRVFTPDLWIGHLGAAVSLLMSRRELNYGMLSAEWLKQL